MLIRGEEETFALKMFHCEVLISFLRMWEREREKKLIRTACEMQPIYSLIDYKREIISAILYCSFKRISGK